MGKSTTQREQHQFGSDLTLFHEVMVAGRKAGADPYFWNKLVREEALFKQVVQQVNSYLSPKTGCSVAEAARVMGKNFHSSVTVKSALGLVLRDKLYNQVPYSPQALYAHKDSHILVAVPNINDNVLQSGTRTMTMPMVASPGDLFHESVEKGWYLVSNGPVSGVIHGPLYSSSALIVAYAHVLHKLATGKDLIDEKGVMTQSKVSPGVIVSVKARGEEVWFEPIEYPKAARQGWVGTWKSGS